MRNKQKKINNNINKQASKEGSKQTTKDKEQSYKILDGSVKIKHT
jgi:hypothetical protein